MSVKRKIRAHRVDREDVLQLCPKFGRGPSCKYWCPYTEKSNFTVLRAGVKKICFLEEWCFDEACSNSPYVRREYDELLKQSSERAEQWAQEFIKNQQRKKDDS